MNHNIGQVIERAVRNYILTELPVGVDDENPNGWLPETQVYRGIENREDQSMEGQESSLRIYPCVICICQSAAAVFPHWRGLWTPVLTIEVWNSRAKVTGDTQDARAKQVFDMFSTNTITKDLSDSTPNFIIRGLLPREWGMRPDGRAWCNYMTYEVAQAATFPS